MSLTKHVEMAERMRSNSSLIEHEKLSEKKIYLKSLKNGLEIYTITVWCGIAGCGQTKKPIMSVRHLSNH